MVKDVVKMASKEKALSCRKLLPITLWFPQWFFQLGDCNY